MDQQSKIDIGMATALILFSVLVFVLSSGYPIPKSGLPVNAFPRILAGIMLVLSGALIVTAVRNRATRPLCFKGFTKGPKLIMVVTGILIGYILILKYMGFLLSSMLFMMMMLRLFGERRKGVLILLPAGFVAALYIIFQKLAMVPLPKGIMQGLF